MFHLFQLPINLQTVCFITNYNYNNLNFQDYNGDTPLMYLCNNSHISNNIIIFFINSLIFYGFDLNVKNFDNSTALISLCKNFLVDFEILSFFLSKNIDVLHLDNNLNPALFYLSKQKFINFEMLALFIKFYPNKNHFIDYIGEINYNKFKSQIDFHYQ